MIRNYLTVALRNLLRNRSYAFINMAGLTIGITSCIIIFLIINYDLGFDKFHSKYDRIYRVVRENKLPAVGIEYGTVTPYPFARAFHQDFPEIPLLTEFEYQQEVLVSSGSEKQQADAVIFADSLFFRVFDFEVLSGDPNRELGLPGKVFLTESFAAGMNLKEGDRIRLNNKLELAVAGLLKDPPPHSHMDFSLIASMPSFTTEYFGWPLDSWGMTASAYSYLVLPENMKPEQVTEKFKGFVQKYHSADDAKAMSYHLQPLKNIHFDGHYVENPGKSVNISYNSLFVLGALGVFIMVIACINFINLATALALKKSKEVGVRKTLGARRGQLTVYFLGETLLLTLFAVIISMGLTEWILPWLRDFTERALYLDLLGNPGIIIFLLVLIVAATLFSGFYPAIVLAGFNPAAVLKNKISGKGSSNSSVRRFLVVFQFLIAQVMIIGTLVISDQMDYFHTKSLGFNKDAIVTIPLPDNKMNQLESLRARLATISGVESFSFCVGAPTSNNNMRTGFFLEERGPEESYRVGIKTADYYYRDTYGIKLKAGRWFYEEEEKRANDTSLNINERYVLVINEAAARQLGFDDPEQALGKRIGMGLYDVKAPVVGVVEDFHTSSLHEVIEPVVIINFPSLYYDVGIRIKPQDMPGTISAIEKTWSSVYPEYYFEYEFLDDHLEGLYRQESRTLTLFKVFSSVSIFIGCLGLLGLVSFMATQKVKEIGVRKVFGASVTNIVMLFSKEFTRLVIIAFLLAAPLSWYLMHQWLQTFAYRVDIHWGVFAIGISFTLFIALAAVSYRSIRAAYANPVDTLRTE